MRRWVFLVVFSSFLLAYGWSHVTRKHHHNQNLLNVLKKKAESNQLKPTQKFLLLLMLEASKRAAAHKRQKRGFLANFSEGVSHTATGFLNASINVVDQIKTAFDRGSRKALEELADNVDSKKYIVKNQVNRTTPANTTTVKADDISLSSKWEKLTKKNLYVVTIPFVGAICVLVFILAAKHRKIIEEQGKRRMRQEKAEVQAEYF